MSIRPQIAHVTIWNTPKSLWSKGGPFERPWKPLASSPITPITIGKPQPKRICVAAIPEYFVFITPLSLSLTDLYSRDIWPQLTLVELDLIYGMATAKRRMEFLGWKLRSYPELLISFSSRLKVMLTKPCFRSLQKSDRSRKCRVVLMKDKACLHGDDYRELAITCWSFKASKVLQCPVAEAACFCHGCGGLQTVLIALLGVQQTCWIIKIH